MHETALWKHVELAQRQETEGCDGVHQSFLNLFFFMKIVHFFRKIGNFCRKIGHFINRYKLGDPEVTANLYCNFAYLCWEGCVICSIYLR